MKLPHEYHFPGRLGRVGSRDGWEGRTEKTLIFKQQAEEESAKKQAGSRGQVQEAPVIKIIIEKRVSGGHGQHGYMLQR